MGRTLGVVLGGLMLANGLSDTINPRFDFKIWNQFLRRYSPDWLKQDVDEYARLSDSSLRYLTVWEMLVGLLVLWLALRSRD